MVNSLPTAAFYLCFGSSSVSQFYKIQSKFAITKKKAWDFNWCYTLQIRWENSKNLKIVRIPCVHEDIGVTGTFMNCRREYKVVQTICQFLIMLNVYSSYVAAITLLANYDQRLLCKCLWQLITPN